MKKSRIPILAAMAVIFSMVFLPRSATFRLDLTKEKRFSLTRPTLNLFDSLESKVKIIVYLTGDLPSDFKKLSVAVKDFLEEYGAQSNHKIDIVFQNPGEDLPNDTAKAMLYDSLSKLGAVFERTDAVKGKGTSAPRFICPSAMIIHGDKKMCIDLRSSKKIYKHYDVINDTPEEDVEATRNAAEALLEYKFTNAVYKMTRKKIPVVAYTIGNGEPIDRSVNDLGECLRNEYNLGVLDIRQTYPNAGKVDLLLIVKPMQRFTEEDKLRIDQYVMHGGKVIWCIDKLYAELDSLMRSRSDYTAYERDLNLDDILFRYGVRIKGELLQDLNCAKIPLVIGYNPDNSPRMQRVPWAYYPLLVTNDECAITKNLDKVLPIFPCAMDTVKAEGIKKTILLTSDTNSRVLGTPALVSVNNVKTEEDFKSFVKSHIPVAILLEGKFKSLFANRLTSAMKDSVAKAIGSSFLENAATEGKQIVISDADIVTNHVSTTTGPIQMGELPFDNYRFANKEFFLNCVDYMTSGNGIFECRNKEFVLRLLDKKKTQEEKFFWQCFNIGFPVATILLTGLFFQWHRKKKYSI